MTWNPDKGDGACPAVSLYSGIRFLGGLPVCVQFYQQHVRCLDETLQASTSQISVSFSHHGLSRSEGPFVLIKSHSSFEVSSRTASFLGLRSEYNLKRCVNIENMKSTYSV